MEEYLKRIADSLERAFPLEPDISFFEKSAAFIWEADQNHCTEVTDVQTVDISLLKGMDKEIEEVRLNTCLLYTSPSPRDNRVSRMPSSA